MCAEPAHVLLAKPGEHPVRCLLGVAAPLVSRADHPRDVRRHRAVAVIERCLNSADHRSGRSVSNDPVEPAVRTIRGPPYNLSRVGVPEFLQRPRPSADELVQAFIVEERAISSACSIRSGSSMRRGVSIVLARGQRQGFTPVRYEPASKCCNDRETRSLRRATVYKYPLRLDFLPLQFLTTSISLLLSGDGSSGDGLCCGRPTISVASAEGIERSVMFPKFNERASQRGSAEARCHRGKHEWRTRGRANALTYVCQVCGETSDKPPRSKWGATEAPYDKAAGG